MKCSAQHAGGLGALQHVDHRAEDFRPSLSSEKP
jgi:hypothetical protein